jgi:hypothetical protein
LLTFGFLICWDVPFFNDFFLLYAMI